MRTRIASLVVLLVLSGNVAGAEDPGPLSVEKMKLCLSSNIPPDVRAQSVEFLSTDREGGTRKLTGRIFASQEVFAASTTAGPPKQKQVRAVLQVDAPKDLAGAAYLVREAGTDAQDGTYFYLPSVGKVRRITGASATSSLLGTDFSFLEFKLLLNSFQGTTATLESLGELDGRKVFVVNLKPNEAAANVGVIRGWIDQETCVPLKLDFYQGDKLRKQALIRPDAVRAARDIWFPTEIDMKDLGAGSHTVLRAVIVERKYPVAGDVFDVEKFYKPYELTPEP